MPPFEVKLNKSLCLKNASNLKHKFLNRFFWQNFLVKIFMKSHVSNVMHFQDELDNLFFMQKKVKFKIKNK